MQGAPGDEGPRRAVPEAPEEHGDEQVAVGARGALAVAPERDVEVVAQPRREGDVPAAPEVREVAREVGRAKVLGELEAQHRRGAHRDVAVGREIQVDLQRVAVDREEVLGRREVRRGGEDPVDQGHREGVGEAELLRHAQRHAPEALQRAARVHRGGGCDLREELLRAHDGPGHELRKEQHEGRELPERRRGPQAPSVHVHGVRERLEGVKRDPRGEDQAPRLPPRLAPHRAGQGREVLAEEVCVLEHREDAQVRDQRDHQHHPPRPG